MKLIRIFMAFVVISLVIGIGSAFNGQAGPKQDKIKSSQIEYEEQSNVENITQGEELEENEIVSTEKDLSTEVVDKEIKQEEVENKQEVDVPKRQEQVTNNVVNQPKQEEKQEMTAWQELGISEEEYYNKPMWKWAKVDFSIEEYGSEENCFKACVDYGESTGMGYSCSIINSYSGRYLGEMIKLF